STSSQMTFTGGAAGAGGMGASTSSSGVGGFATSSTGGAGGAGGGCGGKAAKARPAPPDPFLVPRPSGAMDPGAGNNLTRWDTVKAAVTTFVQQPNTAGIGMGIQYFPLPEQFVAGCYVQECAADADCMGGCGACNVPSGVCTSPYNPDNDSC